MLDYGAVSDGPSCIVATILCGNAESIIEPAILSIRDWVDAICLIDTGCTDGTLAKAASVAQGRSSRIAFKWCGDFSKARNAALAAAEYLHATWALTLDTDERLDFTGYATKHQLLETLDSETGVRAWMVPTADKSYVKERFIRVPTTLRWQGRTHEALMGATDHQRRLLRGCHFREVAKSPEAFQIKFARDLDILLDETKSQPENPRWWYYLGQTYEGLQQHRQAIDAFHRCVSLNGWPDESSWACFCAARCLVALHEYREAEEFCQIGRARKPSAPELPWMIAWCCFQRSAWTDAVTWANRAIELGDRKSDENWLGFRYTPAWYEAPYDVLRYAYRQLEIHELANRAAMNFQLAKNLRLRTADPLKLSGIVVHQF